MKKLGILLLAAAFAVCGLMTFAACNEETPGPGDDPIVTPGPDDPGKPEEPGEPTPPDEPEATEGLVFELLTTENSDGFEEILGADFEDCYVCTGLTVAEENVVIPSTYNGLPVRMVRWHDLEPEISNRIVSIYIPDSIQFVGFAYDYYNNSDYENLTEIRLPRNPNAMILGSSYFSGCAFYNDPSNWEDGALYMDDWLLATNGDLPEEYTVKQGTFGIAMGAFLYQDNEDYKSHVKKVTVPDGVQALVGSFTQCDSLEEVVLPDSLSSIGYNAFLLCNSLTSITIPDSVTSIGGGAFLSCSSLTSVTIPDGVTAIGDGAFYDCDSLTSITIPDSVTAIGDGAFYDCGSLTNIMIPDSVTSIGESAFSGCDSLTSIAIPDNVTFIGNFVFRGCSSLTSIVIPDGVTIIGDSAFSSCYSLTSITIPDSITSIGEWAFYNCDSLTTVYYRGSEEEWNEIEIRRYNDALEDAEIIFNYTGE